MVCVVVGKEEIDVTARGEKCCCSCSCSCSCQDDDSSLPFNLSPEEAVAVELQEVEGLDRHTDGRMSDPLAV